MEQKNRFFTFQESKIMEAGNPVDPNGRIARVKVRGGERRARQKLPITSLGRTWVLINTEE